jgi:hypothetical protein
VGRLIVIGIDALRRQKIADMILTLALRSRRVRIHLLVVMAILLRVLVVVLAEKLIRGRETIAVCRSNHGILYPL